MKRDWNVFVSSLFFVAGFSLVFALLGVLLQSVLSQLSYNIEEWISKIGGIIIVLFGLYLIGIIKPGFMNREYKINLKHKFKSSWIASFVFGAAFAVGWTPCVGAVLGAILTLAATQPALAFPLMLSYSLGLGVPFLLVGLFTNEAQRFIKRNAKYMQYLNKFFGFILIIIGVLVFSRQLSSIANFAGPVSLVLGVENSVIGTSTSLNIFIAFIAGIISFLSPCVLPLIPGYLTYLAGISIKEK